ncbi:hypothetical protein [Halorussus sp. MSC15.2]|uniref:hypothetical protein n=1 Tax=Halorussus sp. MSC15.2 TaxID=2283638 RepID=UPI0013D82ADE|nr:hypothetical protein [Halorussus sp. MSC15.2]NEU56965.1 hypothetical protein [Halorussus sp. MSC15.2]
MNRRQVLALLGSAAAGGCLGGSESPPATTSRSTSSVGTTGQTTESEPETRTETPDQPELGVRNPEGCPPFDSDVKRVVCASAVGDDAPMTLGPAGQSGSLPRAEFSFTLTNGTDAVFTVNYHAWEIWKRVDGEWFRIAPRSWPQPAMFLRPGGAHTWHLTVDNTDLDRPIPHSGGTESVTVAGLGPGTYAFGTDGWFRGQSYENATGFAARFELTGESLELAPTGIDRTERDGDTVVLHDDPEENEDRAAYVVTRVESAPEESRRMITEQVIRRTPLRNALAHFESGVRTVRLEAGTGTSPAFGVSEARYVEYEGQTYRIETEKLEAKTTDS